MSSVIDSLPPEYQRVFVEVLGERAPDVLKSLRAEEKPTRDEQDAVLHVLADAFHEHLGPGYEPTPKGVLIDNALGAFLLRWPMEG